MPQNWEEFKAERPSWKDFKAARRTSLGSMDKLPWAVFVENPDDQLEWVQYWSSIVAAQGTEPSSSAKLKRMAKWYKKHVDESFDVKEALVEFKQQSDTLRSQASNADDDSVRSRDSVGSRSSQTNPTGSVQGRRSQPTTERFASWGRNHNVEPPTAAENVTQTFRPLIEITHYAKREPLMTSRLALYAGIFLALIPAFAYDNATRSWYYRALCIAMAGSGLDLFMSPQFNAAVLLQIVSSTEAGHGLVFATMHFMRMATPTCIALIPVAAISVVGLNELADDPRAPPSLRYFPRDSISAGTQNILRAASIIEVVLLPIQVYYWVSGFGSLLSIVAYAYTYLRMRYVAKRTHRMIWGDVHTFIRSVQTQYRASIPPQVNDGITTGINYLGRLMPMPIPEPPLH